MNNRRVTWTVFALEHLVGTTLATYDELIANLDGWVYIMDFPDRTVYVLGPAQ